MARSSRSDALLRRLSSQHRYAQMLRDRYQACPCGPSALVIAQFRAIEDGAKNAIIENRTSPPSQVLACALTKRFAIPCRWQAKLSLKSSNESGLRLIADSKADL